MPRTRQPHSKRRQTSSVLHARVITPRIAWLGTLRWLGGFARLAGVAAVVTGLGWALWQGVQRAFYDNPDFRLQVIELNPNPVLDELGLIQLGGIRPDGSLFEVDLRRLDATLRARPDVLDVHAERELPGTLRVRLVTRTPRVWITAPGAPAPRRIGGWLADADGVVYPCSPRQLESADGLPLVRLPPEAADAVRPGETLEHPALGRALRLLATAEAVDPQALSRVASVSQGNAWSLTLLTRCGVEATFGLRDHERQFSNLLRALGHAGDRGYEIATINLIPRENVPITLRGEAPVPRAVPVEEPSAEELREERRERDIHTLLNRG